MFGLFRKKSGSTPFWEWLAANTGRIHADFKKNIQSISKEIGSAFGQSYPGLTWEISPSQSPPWLFCVSADGNRDLFSKVEQAVREAPQLKGWKVQAFRPRGSLTAEIEMGGHTLGYDDIWCSVEGRPDGVAVTLWIRGLSPESDSVLSRAAVILLDNAVGEYDAVVKIKQLNRGPLPPSPQKTGDFFPLSELPRFLDTVQGS